HRCLPSFPTRRSSDLLRALDVPLHAVEVVDALRLGVDREPELGEIRERTVVRAGRRGAFETAELVDPDRQRTPRGDFGILLAQRDRKSTRLNSSHVKI